MESTLKNLTDAIRHASLKIPPPSPYMSSELLGDLKIFFVDFEKYVESLYGNNERAWLQLLPDFLEGEACNILKAF